MTFEEFCKKEGVVILPDLLHLVKAVDEGKQVQVYWSGRSGGRRNFLRALANYREHEQHVHDKLQRRLADAMEQEMDKEIDKNGNYIDKNIQIIQLQEHVIKLQNRRNYVQQQWDILYENYDKIWNILMYHSLCNGKFPTSEKMYDNFKKGLNDS